MHFGVSRVGNHLTSVYYCACLCWEDCLSLSVLKKPVPLLLKLTELLVLLPCSPMVIGLNLTMMRLAAQSLHVHIMWVYFHTPKLAFDCKVILCMYACEIETIDCKLLEGRDCNEQYNICKVLHKIVGTLNTSTFFVAEFTVYRLHFSRTLKTRMSPYINELM